MIKELLKSIRPDTEISEAERRRIKTPRALKATLVEHQKLGWEWLRRMEESGEFFCSFDSGINMKLTGKQRFEVGFWRMIRDWERRSKRLL